MHCISFKILIILSLFCRLSVCFLEMGFLESECFMWKFLTLLLTYSNYYCTQYEFFFFLRNCKRFFLFCRDFFFFVFLIALVALRSDLNWELCLCSLLPRRVLTLLYFSEGYLFINFVICLDSLDLEEVSDGITLEFWLGELCQMLSTLVRILG